MIVADVISRVKRQFGDESGAQVIDEDIIRWINDGQNEIAQMQDLLEASAITLTAEGKVDYELPPNMVSLKSVYYDDRKVENLSSQEFDEWIRKWNDGSKGSGDTWVYTSWGNKITLFPNPMDRKELKLTYSCFPAPVEATTDSLNIPLRYHNRVVEYVLQQAYELDENFEAAAYKANQISNSMSQLLGDEDWDEKAEYPSILVRSEDAW
jgi:hypothetical protein